ncbi:Crp/Fnr family transcriptional regulator [Salidesulfovibrio onnuriiensis]|uniref:Crp/Fnr family transcriptional regulator n=1 Tax=Salidesulfovibrio onnuriiensis TaxID=2583823 RepID=UPI0011C73A2D|nr:cyclic nucleotide-binding domain-containing protein [Salidesulfovibrio onnuriiensis]
MTSKQNVQNVKTFFKDQVIFKEGQQAGYAYMVKKGTVTLYRTVDNRKIVLDQVGKGEIFGEMGALTGLPRSTSAEASEFCELMVLTENIIQSLLEKCPKTIQHLTRLLIEKLRKKTRLDASRAGENTFLSICRIMEMAWRVHAHLPPIEQKKHPNYKAGMSLTELSRQIKDILLTPQSEIRSTVDQLQRLKIIEVTKGKGAKAFDDLFIRIKDAENFFQVASNLYKELNKSGALNLELELIDIFDLAEELGADPQILYKKMANSEVPESLFLFHKKNALAWAAEQPADFFKKVQRKKKKVEDLEDVNDIIFVDNATLKQVFADLGYYKLGVLMSLADGDANRKIQANLAKKIAQVVMEEAENRGPVDDMEADDIQEELIELIKAAKGVKTS